MLEREGGTLSVQEAFESDELLVASLLQGNSDAAGSLFDRYGAYIQRVLARILGYSEPERADLLHEVFVRALERLADLKNARALKPWLVGIAVFTAQEWLRQRKRRGPLLPEEDGAAREAIDATPEAREAVRCFYQLVGRFADDERAAFILRQLEGMSLNEVAAACNVSLSTARRRIDRAERRFQQLLPEYPALLERGQQKGRLK
jgi:RNA polymerase sigma-70 factor (ECF subfamily)